MIASLKRGVRLFALTCVYDCNDLDRVALMESGQEDSLRIGLDLSHDCR